MADIDTSKYCVVQITEYQDMKAEIERLRAIITRQGIQLIVAHSENAGMYEPNDD